MHIFLFLLPQLILFLSIVLVFGIDLVGPKEKKWLPFLALTGSLASLAASIYLLGWGNISSELVLGGMIAIDFTLEYPDMVDALIPVASGLTGYQYGDAEKLEPKFKAIFKAAETESIDKAVDMLLDLPYFIPADENSEVRQKMRTMAKENYKTWSAPQDIQIWPSPPAIERLSEMKVPTLIIVGDHDVSDIFGVADTLESKIPGAKKVIIQGAGHHVNMEKPEAFNRIVLDFLASL